MSSASLTANPDLARLVRLQASLVASTPLEPTTPLFGIGMSNGSRFVTLWGQAWHDAGYPVDAIWASAGRIANPVVDGGGLDVPTFFTTSVNDTTVPPQEIVDDHADTVAAGTPTELRISAERPLTTLPFLRIPGIDSALAEEVVAALRATGVWDASGTRVVSPVTTAISQATTVTLPAAVTTAGLAPDVADQAAVILAAHQFSAEFKLDALTFFETHRTP